MSAKDIDKQIEKQQEHDLDLANIQQGQIEAENARKEFLQELSRTELNEGSKNLLRNLVSPDFIYANYNTQDIDRLRYELILMKMQYLDMHPGRDCIVTGELRKYGNDDPNGGLTRLSPEDRTIIDGLFEGLFARITRGEGGFQQEMLNKSISVSEVTRDDKKQRNGLIDKLKP